MRRNDAGPVRYSRKASKGRVCTTVVSHLPALHGLMCGDYSDTKKGTNRAQCAPGYCFSFSRFTALEQAKPPDSSSTIFTGKKKHLRCDDQRTTRFNSFQFLPH